jgi:hypothetical protein
MRISPASRSGVTTFSTPRARRTSPASSSESDAHFEKTLAAQIEKALDKEFDKADEEQSGVLGEGAGRSFNETKAAGRLETVVRVSRTGGGVAHEVVETDFDLGGGGGDGARPNATGDADRRAESLFERLESKAKDIDRALGGKDADEDVERLVDSRDNEFVISNPKSGTMELQQDLRLISDLVIILVASAAGAAVFTLIGQPLITGYLIAGSLVGPGGFGLVVELVQVETLAQFGIIFLLFALGVEFSFAQLRHVQSVAVFGGSMQIRADDVSVRRHLGLHRRFKQGGRLRGRVPLDVEHGGGRKVPRRTRGKSNHARPDHHRHAHLTGLHGGAFVRAVTRARGHERCGRGRGGDAARRRVHVPLLRRPPSV